MATSNQIQVSKQNKKKLQLSQNFKYVLLSVLLVFAGVLVLLGCFQNPYDWVPILIMPIQYIIAFGVVPIFWFQRKLNWKSALISVFVIMAIGDLGQAIAYQFLHNNKPMASLKLSMALVDIVLLPVVLFFININIRFWGGDSKGQQAKWNLQKKR